VCDTNVLVSAVLFPRSVPGQAIAYARANGVVLTTNELVTELRDVLARSKFDRYLTREIRDEFLAGYIFEAEFVPLTERVTVCRDPKDDHVLDAAINGQATCIISGDDDLLTLVSFQGIPILTPADFLARS
jgi:putative PIN family toxin of toxin-antitoxin system